MIVTEKIHQCNRCQGTHLTKNGLDRRNGKQKYRCKDCGSYGTLNPSERYSEERKEEILRVYQERSSLRGTERAMGVSRQAIAKWLKKKSNLLEI